MSRSIDFQAVRSMISIANVLDLVDFVPATSTGNQVRGPCPIHDSQSSRGRTFSVNMKRNAYQCFKCGSSGNQLDLWAAITKADLHPATIDLCNKFGCDVRWLGEQ